jgi:hypothetical protein
MSEGGCHCGAVRFAVEGAPAFSALCHCADCRRCSGAPVTAWGMFPTEAFSWTKGEPRLYASSEHSRRWFCGDCGTGLAYVNEAMMPGVVDIQVATLDDPGAIPPLLQMQMADAISWMATAHTLPAHDRFPPQP